MRKHFSSTLLIVSLVLCGQAGAASAFQEGRRRDDPTKNTPKPKAEPKRGGGTKAAPPPKATRVMTADLTIAADPASSVLLNGQARGTTDANGQLTLKGLKAGLYRLSVRKPHYQNEERSLILLAGQNRTENLALIPLPVAVNVSTNQPGTKIIIKDIGEYSESVSGLQLRPGVYQIVASKPGYRTITRSLTLMPGQPSTLPLTLEAMTVEEMIASGKEFFEQRNYTDAIALFRAVLVSQPNNAAVNRLLGWSYYATGSYAESANYFAKTISLNEQVIFPVRHRHNQLWETCLGTITLGKGTFAFKSQTAYVAGHDFEIPYSKFKEFYLRAGAEGELHTKVRIPKPDGKKGENEKDYNFYVPEADTRSSLIMCANCQQRMQIINQLMLESSRQAAGK